MKERKEIKSVNKQTALLPSIGKIYLTRNQREFLVLAKMDTVPVKFMAMDIATGEYEFFDHLGQSHSSSLLDLVRVIYHNGLISGKVQVIVK